MGSHQVVGEWAKAFKEAETQHRRDGKRPPLSLERVRLREVANVSELVISVIGSGEADAETAALAEEVGRLLARRGVTVACGGLGGVMAAVCRGAKAEGGRTIGILPGDDPRDANPWVEVAVCTGIGYARNIIVVKTGWAVIAVGGAYGTLSEIGHALAEGIPVVGLRTWELARNGARDDGIIPALDPQDAVEKAVALAHRRMAGPRPQGVRRWSR